MDCHFIANSNGTIRLENCIGVEPELASHTAETVVYYGLVVLGIIALVGFVYLFFRFANFVRYVPNSRVGVVEFIFSRRGSVRSGFMALAGEVGYQPEVLRGGIHFFLPFCRRLHVVPLVTVGQGQLAYVFARDGLPLDPAQALARDVGDFTDVRAFLAATGQRGPQRRLLREGTHVLNLAQFAVVTSNRIFGIALSQPEDELLKAMQSDVAERRGFEPLVINAKDDLLGVVTIHDGPLLPSGEIIASDVGVDFQDAENFITHGGSRGRQLRVLTEGTYYLNCLFATIDLIKKTTVEVGSVGVVVSYTGGKGTDVSADDYHHGELVEQGFAGIWSKPLLPGKYAFNTFAGRITMIPTINFILEWESGESTGMMLDEDLTEIKLITKDAFEPLLPLSVVMHINYEEAPLLVQRFGDVKKLVNQTLNPMVSAYFKNIGQTMTLIELLQNRAQIQTQAKKEMGDMFERYNLKLQEVLIGTPKPDQGDQGIEKILLQLRDRQVAKEQIATYQSQGDAAVAERVLNETRATASMQKSLTESAIGVRVAENQGSASVIAAEKEAAKIRALASADADAVKMEGDGEASKIRAIGEANAAATTQQVAAYGGPETRLADVTFQRLFDAIREGKLAIVPQTLVVGSGAEGTGILPNGLISGVLAGLMPKPSKAAIVEQDR